MFYNTLSEAFQATELKAKIDYKLEVEMPMVFGGISYDEKKHFCVDPSNRIMRSDKTRRWHVTVLRDGRGLYETIDYYA